MVWRTIYAIFGVVHLSRQILLCRFEREHTLTYVLEIGSLTIRRQTQIARHSFLLTTALLKTTLYV